MRRSLLAIVAAAAALAAQQVVKRNTISSDLPDALAPLFPGFDAFRSGVERATARRLHEGEKDHFVFYLLQSTRFTDEARIEPALSARTFHNTGRIPANVLRRMSDFLAAPKGLDERLDYFRASLNLTQPDIQSEYERAMRSLYRKELASGKNDVAEWYQSRGHSSDTQIEANYAVWSGLRVIAALYPDSRVHRALIVGPGLDFAPRTALSDEAPRSYQPYALADALLGLKLADFPDLRIHCVDINPRVVDFLNAHRQASLPLHTHAADEGYAEYVAQLGRAIGDRPVSERISASLLNVITERIVEPKFNVAVITNVLLYMNSKELAMALCNVEAMLEPGGFVITNELRPEMDLYTAAVGLRPVQARTLRIDNALFDSFAIYTKIKTRP